MAFVFCIALAGVFATSQTVYAAETGVVEVATAEEYDAARTNQNRDVIKLTANIDISSLDYEAHNINVYKDLTIDLNGYTFTLGGRTLKFWVYDSVDITITDSSTEKTGKIFQSGNSYAVYIVYYGNQGYGDNHNVNLIIDGVTVEGSDSCISGSQRAFEFNTDKGTANLIVKNSQIKNFSYAFNSKFTSVKLSDTTISVPAAANLYGKGYLSTHDTWTVADILADKQELVIWNATTNTLHRTPAVTEGITSSGNIYAQRQHESSQDAWEIRVRRNPLLAPNYQQISADTYTLTEGTSTVGYQFTNIGGSNTLTVTGEHTINLAEILDNANNSYGSATGIYSLRDLTIDGTGTLNINVNIPDDVACADNKYGIKASNLVIKGSVTVNITVSGGKNGNAYGIYVDDSFAIQESACLTVSVTNSTGFNGYGIASFYGQVNIGGIGAKSVTITKSDGYGDVYGIYCFAGSENETPPANMGDINVSGAGKLTVTMPENKGTAIVTHYHTSLSPNSKNTDGTITLNGADVTINNGKTAIWNTSFKRATDTADIIVKDSTLTINNSSTGIQSYYNGVWLDNSTVNVEATTYAVLLAGPDNFGQYSNVSAYGLYVSGGKEVILKSTDNRTLYYSNTNVNKIHEVNLTYGGALKIQGDAYCIMGYWKLSENSKPSIGAIYSNNENYKHPTENAYRGSAVQTSGDPNFGKFEIIYREIIKIDAPTATPNLVYDGTEKTGVAEGTGYTLGEIYKATDAGNYTAKATLLEGYKWSDNTTAPKQIDWSIAKKQIAVPTATNFTYDGNYHTAIEEREGYYSINHEEKNAGDYTATVTLYANYAWTGGNTDSKTIPWKISRKVIQLPTVATGLVYTEEVQTGFEKDSNSYRIISGTNVEWKSGTHTAVLQLLDKTNTWWAGETTDDQTITWSIAKADVSAPTGIGSVACTTIANNDGQITGVGSSMEYRLKGSETWTAVSGFSITGLAAGDYEVRIKEKDHYNASEITEVTVEEHAHTGGTATCAEKATCSVCHEQYGEFAAHTFGEWVEQVAATCTTTGTLAHKDCTVCHKHFDSEDNEITDLTIAIDSTAHNFATAWSHNATYHWHGCECGAKQDEAAHTFVGDTCSVCGYEKHVHAWAEDWTSNATHHWHECSNADCDVTEDSAKDGYTAHVFNKQVTNDTYKASDATCTEKAKYYLSCECGAKGAETYEVGELAAHVYDNIKDTACNNCSHTRTAPALILTHTDGTTTELIADATDEGGKWTWAASTKTLTLNGWTGMGIDTGNEAFKLHLIGNNTINMQNEATGTVYGIQGYPTVTADEGGTLSVNALNIVNSNGATYLGIYGMVLNSGTVNVKFTATSTCTARQLCAFDRVVYINNSSTLNIGIDASAYTSYTNAYIGTVSQLSAYFNGGSPTYNINIKGGTTTRTDGLNAIFSGSSAAKITSKVSGGGRLLAVTALSTLKLAEGGFVDFDGGYCRLAYLGSASIDKNSQTTNPANNQYTLKTEGSEIYLCDKNGNKLTKGRFEYIAEAIPFEVVGGVIEGGLHTFTLPGMKVGDTRSDYNPWFSLYSTLKGYEEGKVKFEVTEGTLPKGLTLENGATSSTTRIAGSPTEVTPAGYVIIKATETVGDLRSVTFKIKWSEIKEPHTHAWAEDWTINDTHHWHECSNADCDVTANSNKNGYGAHDYDNACDTTCDVCGYERTVAHNFGEWVETTPATEQSAGLRERECSVCQQKETETIPQLEHTHNHASEWSKDENGHYHECACGDKKDSADHVYTDEQDTTCDVCGYERTVTPIDPVDPNPTDPTNPTEPTEPTEKEGLSGGAIAGIAVGGVAVAGGGGFAIFWFAVKKKSFAELVAAIKAIFKK